MKDNQTKIEDCLTVTILSPSEILKNHVLKLTTMATLILLTNIGTLILVGSVQDMIEFKTLWSSSCLHRVSSTGSATLPTGGTGTFFV